LIWYLLFFLCFWLLYVSSLAVLSCLSWTTFLFCSLYSNRKSVYAWNMLRELHLCSGMVVQLYYLLSSRVVYSLFVCVVHHVVWVVVKQVSISAHAQRFKLLYLFFFLICISNSFMYGLCSWISGLWIYINNFEPLLVNF
jgi:hypothetical protein